MDWKQQTIHHLNDAMIKMNLAKKVTPVVYKDLDKIDIINSKINNLILSIEDMITPDKEDNELQSKYDKIYLFNLIKTHSKYLILPEDIDLIRLLWAILGAESSFGQNVKKRIEPIYCPGGKYYNMFKRIRDDYKKYKEDACASWGPWQVMYPTSRELGFKGTPKELHNPETNLMYCIKYINKRSIQRGATTVIQIADGYNTGTHRDKIHNYKYETEVKRYYDNGVNLSK